MKKTLLIIALVSIVMISGCIKSEYGKSFTTNGNNPEKDFALKDCEKVFYIFNSEFPELLNKTIMCSVETKIRYEGNHIKDYIYDCWCEVIE